MLIRPAFDAQELDQVYRLTHDAYVEQGYIQARPDGLLRHYAEVDAAPENMVLVAVEDGIVVGTVSVTLDGPAGFHVDHDFPAECAAIRAEGGNVGASWRIITAPGYRSSMSLVVDLIRSTIDVLHRFDVETILCSFNPRHERIYRKMFGMSTVAHSDGVGAVKSPAVLMRASISEAVKSWPPPFNPALATLAAERARLLHALSRLAVAA